MRLLFVHQNFPGQFKHLEPALAVDPANEVVAFTMQKNAPASWQGVRLLPVPAQCAVDEDRH